MIYFRLSLRLNMLAIILTGIALPAKPTISERRRTRRIIYAYIDKMGWRHDKAITLKNNKSFDDKGLR